MQNFRRRALAEAVLDAAPVLRVSPPEVGDLALLDLARHRPHRADL